MGLGILEGLRKSWSFAKQGFFLVREWVTSFDTQMGHRELNNGKVLVRLR